jgi:hypothetical protein
VPQVSLVDPIRRPAVRVPLILAVVVGLSLLTARTCREQTARLDALRLRHLSFMRLLGAAATETGSRPGSLGQLVWAPEAGGIPPLHRVFLRDFAELPEFRALASNEAAELERLGEVQVWTGSGELRHEQEILWSGYLFRLYPAPGNARDYVIFSWPLETAGPGLVLAWISTDPGRFYYTFSPRYSGPGKGPTLEDLGEAPFELKIRLVEAGPQGPDPNTFPARAREAQGRLWAVDRLPGAPAGAGAAGAEGPAEADGPEGGER